MAMKPSVQVKVHAPSGTIIMQRPEKCNAMSRLMMLEIKRALEDLHQERRVRAVILTGAGDYFSAGIDLSEVQASQQDEEKFQQWHRDTAQFKELLETMLRFPKPIVAAVNGPALAAGAGLVLASDLVLGTPQAQFGFPEPRRGLVAGIVCPLLVFRAGASTAAQLLLASGMHDAEQMLQKGVYHRIVPATKVWAEAHELAKQCAESAPEAIQLTKRTLNETVGEHLATLFSVGASATAAARTTEAAEEGVTAFLEKRPPIWP
jgi:methylglutaconyl-CoA hydratase